MTTSDVLQDARLDRDGLDERTAYLRAELRQRADVTRDQLASLAADLGEDLGDRAAAAREILVDRYHELEHELPVDEFRRRAKLGAWQAAQVGLSGLVTVPGLLVRGLRTLSAAVDDVAVRGADLSERGRELVAAVPPSRAERKRSRRRSVLMGVAAFLVGLVTGWMLGSRESAGYEPPFPPTWDPAPDRPTDGQGSEDETTHSEDVATPSEAPDEQQPQG